MKFVLGVVAGIMLLLILEALSPMPCKADEHAALANGLAVEQTADCFTAVANVRNGGRDALLHIVGADRSVPKCMFAMVGVNLIFRKFASNETIRIGMYADGVGVGMNIHFLIGEKHKP